MLTKQHFLHWPPREIYSTARCKERHYIDEVFLQRQNWGSNTCPSSLVNSTLPDYLNYNFVRFNLDSKHHHTKLTLQKTSPSTLVLYTHEVTGALRHLSPSKAAEPDGVPGRLLKTVQVSSLFNISLAQVTVPICLNSATIKPVPKEAAVRTLNDSSSDPKPLLL